MIYEVKANQRISAKNRKLSRQNTVVKTQKLEMRGRSPARTADNRRFLHPVRRPAEPGLHRFHIHQASHDSGDTEVSTELRIDIYSGIG